MKTLTKVLAAGGALATLAFGANYIHNRFEERASVLGTYREYLKADNAYVSSQEVYLKRARNDLAENPELKAFVKDAMGKGLIDMQDIADLYAERAKVLKHSHK